MFLVVKTLLLLIINITSSIIIVTIIHITRNMFHGTKCLSRAVAFNLSYRWTLPSPSRLWFRSVLVYLRNISKTCETILWNFPGILPSCYTLHVAVWEYTGRCLRSITMGRKLLEICGIQPVGLCQTARHRSYPPQLWGCVEYLLVIVVEYCRSSVFGGWFLD